MGIQRIQSNYQKFGSACLRPGGACFAASHIFFLSHGSYSDRLNGLSWSLNGRPKAPFKSSRSAEQDQHVLTGRSGTAHGNDFASDNQEDADNVFVQENSGLNDNDPMSSSEDGYESEFAGFDDEC